MRVLFSVVGGEGHLRPLLPLARVAQARGHDVVVMAAPALEELLLVERLRFVPARPDVWPQHAPIRAVDRVHEAHVVADAFAGWMARERAEDLLAFCASWRPDLIVRDEMDFATPVVAEVLSVRHVTVLVIAAGGFVRHALVAANLNGLRSQHGLAPDPDLTMLTRNLVLSASPSSFRDPLDPLPATGFEWRSSTATPGATASGTVPALPFRRARPSAPMVYVTLGTIFPTESGDLMHRLVQGAALLDVEVVATLGRETDPASLGAQPPHVHVARHLPQDELLPHCAAVVNHAGSGSLMAALAHALPVVAVPLGADQPGNADRVSALGLGIVLEATSITPAGVATSLAEVLRNPAYRVAAEELAAGLGRLPAPEAAFDRIEALMRN